MVWDRVASSADGQESQPREEKAVSSLLLLGKCRQCRNTVRGETRQPGSLSQAQPHDRVSQGLGGPLSLEGSRGGQAGRKHQCHRCTEGVKEERFEQLSQEAKDSGWRHWGPDTWQNRQPPP